MSEIKRLQTAYNLKKYVAIALCAALLCGCRNLSEVSSQGSFAVQTSVASPTETTAAIQTETSAVTDVSSVPPKTVMSVHEFELITAHSVRITGGLENVKKVNIYVCETSPENNGTVYQRLVFSSDLSDIQPSESGYEIRFDPDNYMEEITYEADNSDIKTEYYAKGVRLGFSDGNSEIISACIPIEVHIETGVVNQYDAQLRGDTACGAASGTLLLQSVLPVWGSQLTSRMSEIRDYSAVSFDYSVGAGFNYYMSGEQIANSVNKYLDDSGIENFEITDLRTEKSTEETLIELISTARPAVLEVCYANGEILNDYAGFSHWIAINGFRLTDSGYEFRWENTIGCEQKWVSYELLENGNKNVTYNSVDFQPTRYIAALSEAVVECLI